MNVLDLRNNLVHLGQLYWDNACRLSGRQVPMPEIGLACFGEFGLEAQWDQGTETRIPTGKVYYQTNSILGQYFPETHEVRLNADWADTLPEEYILHALLPHELAHAFEVGSRTRHWLIFDDEPHGRRWRWVARKYFLVGRPDEGSLDWEELSTLFGAEPGGELPEVMETRTEVSLDETYKIPRHTLFTDDAGDMWEVRRAGWLWHWPTRTYVGINAED